MLSGAKYSWYREATPLDNEGQERDSGAAQAGSVGSGTAGRAALTSVSLGWRPAFVLHKTGKHLLHRTVKTKECHTCETLNTETHECLIKVTYGFSFINKDL